MRLKLTGEEPAPPPTWIKPQLAKLVDKAPSGPDWLHEIKLDGYRMVSLSARRLRATTSLRKIPGVPVPSISLQVKLIRLAQEDGRSSHCPRRTRDRKFADSPLEIAGFEPSVPDDRDAQ